MLRRDPRWKPPSAARGLGPLIAVATAAFTLSACSWVQSRPEAQPAVADAPGVAPTEASGPAGSTASAANVAFEDEAPLEVSDELLIRIEEVRGATAAQAGAIFANVTESVEECEPVEPGTLNVRVVSESEETTMEVAGGSNVDADTRRCVLAALALVDEEADDGLPDVSAPADRPRNFSSTVSISW